MFDTARHLRVRHTQRPAESGEVGKALVDTVLVYRRSVATYYVVHPLRVETISLIVRRKYHRLGADAFDIVKLHTASDTETLGFISHRRSYTSLLPSDDRFASKRRIPRHFARSKKGIPVDMKYRLWKRP